MSPFDSLRVGYVLKRYPRYSETFITNEILAHEAAGLPLEIFSLRPATDTFFPEQIARVRAPVTYLPSEGKASEFWSALEEAHDSFSGFRSFLTAARDEDALTGCQAMILACLVRRRRINHLHAHFATGAAAVARLAARLAGITFSFTAHAKDIFHESVQTDDLDRKLRGASAVVTVSDFNRTYLRESFGHSAEHVSRVYNGLDLSQFPYTPPGIGRKVNTIVAVGRLVEKKGFDDLIAACELLSAKGQPLTCDIIGGGERESELTAKIEALNLRHCVRLIGPRPPSEVIAAIQNATVLAAPCVVGSDGNRDGLPTVLLEAMALGTPCISTDVTGIPEVLRDGVTGLLVPQRDPPALAAAIARLFNDAQLRSRMAVAARQLIESEFDIHRNTARIRALFQNCCAQPREVNSIQFSRSGAERIEQEPRYQEVC